MDQAPGLSTLNSSVICQVCGTRNPDDQEYCRRCQHKLLVLSGPFFDHDDPFEPPPPEEGFSFDEHLLERISVLEELIKRTAETLGQLLSAVRKQEKKILVNHTGLTALGDLLCERGVLQREELGEVWELRMDTHLRAVDRRERFLMLRDHVLGLYRGGERREFLRLLDEADQAMAGYDLQAAMQILGAAFLLDPDNYELSFFLGESHFEQGESDKALRYFQRVLAVRPDHYEGLVYTGALYYEFGEPERSESFLRRALEIYPEAFLPYFSLGAVYAGRGDLTRAVVYLERAVAIDPVPQALYLLGKCLYEMGQLSAALRRLEEATRLDPEHEEAHKLLALSYLDRRWVRKARTALQQAERLSSQKLHHRQLVRHLQDLGEVSPPLPESEAGRWFGLGETMLGRENPKQAFSAYRSALAAAPDHPLVVLTCALLCQQLGRSRESEALSRKLLERSESEALRTTAGAVLVEALRSQGKYREGSEVAERLLAAAQTDFGRAVAGCELAYNLAEVEEDLDRALELGREALEKAPAGILQLPLAALGWVHLKRREFRQAVGCLARSSELAPTPSALVHLTMALLAAGRRDQARGVLDRSRHLGAAAEGLGEQLLECMRDSRWLGETELPRPSPPR